MNLIWWIIFGALAGWIAGILMGRRMSALANIILGIVGGVTGGFLMINAFGAQGVVGFNLTSLIFAILGAILLLFIGSLVSPRSTEKPRTPIEEAKPSSSESVQPNRETRIPSSQATNKSPSPRIQRQKDTGSVLKRSAGKGATGVIFLSYRRSDSTHVAGRIYDRLVGDFGKVSVFKDVDSIPLGLDFKEYLGEKVGECDVLLAIIGDNWLDTIDATGKRRLEDPADFVRIEIESALARSVPVIPLLVGGAPMPSEEKLPVSLRKLAYRNGIAIRPDPDFHRDMDRLISALKNYVSKNST